ncbi:MAG TPA: tRNA (adenosine(37)-N6)-threonylcarbamoyltransferase complex transferase subunit TsaD [Chlamydiales bacterium]|nr:tRNA (adenosine(37)-N6)-threonylcarbamoyltransferase complex transferase subunit TsaD [Chlamydiales bacterium]
MIVLGLETTCDETAAALVCDGRKILSNVIASSADIHEQYGGVFPELACRRHIDVIISVIEEAIKPLNAAQIDLIAVAKGPGLVGALLIGMQTAKGLSIAWNKPFIGINHVEAHLYAAMMGAPLPLLFPALGIVLSGGHTFLVKILDVGKYELLGTTVDDAIGEAFDKVGILLGLSYPGGPRVEKLALGGNPNRFPFKAGRVKKNPLDFSFSGLKTSVFYAIRDRKLEPHEQADAAASFQKCAFSDVISKAAIAIKSFPCQAIYLGGGVCSNQTLRALFAATFVSMPIFWPPGNLSLDNAAMIAGLGFHKFLQNGTGDPLDLDVQTRSLPT